MKYITFTILLITTLICLACSSPTNENNLLGNNIGIGQSADNSNVNKSVEKVEKKETPKAELTEDLPKFEKEEDYKTKTREKLLKAGWTPAPTEEGKQNCSGQKSLCEELPELEAGPSSPLGQAVLRWKKGDKFLLVSTIDSFLFSSYEFEKADKSKTALNIKGKYVYAETTGIGGDYTFEFKDNNVAALKLLEEDATTNGNGSWSWDAEKEVLTVTMTLTLKMAGDEEPAKATKQTFQFKPVGKNLKVTNTTDYKHLRGKLFEKN